MIKNSVLILGAGASAHFGYPTGASLLTQLRRMDYETAAWFSGNQPALPNSVGATRQLSDVEPYKSFFQELRDQVPANIDSFLRENALFESCGKELITAVILECELSHAQKIMVPSWTDYVVQALFSGCKSAEDILNNSLSVVNLNYDVSFEYIMYEQLHKPERFKEVFSKFLLKLQTKVVHVYGCVRPEKTFEEIYEVYGKAPYSDRVDLRRSHFFLQSKANVGLNVIYGQKEANNTNILKAKKLIEEAENIFILGYGFDPDNNTLLGLDALSGIKKNIYYTVFPEQPRIEKIAKGLFSGHHFESFIGTATAAFEKQFILI